MPLPPITRFTALGLTPSPTNRNNGVYLPPLSADQIAKIPDITLKNGGIWYNDDQARLEARVDDTTIILAAGNGNVSGPANSGDNNIAIFNGTTGKVIKDSGVNIQAVNPNLLVNSFSNKLKSPNVLVNEISNLGHLKFTNDLGIIFVDSLMPVEFITNDLGSESQVCSLFTGGLPSSSTTPSALVELQSDTGALLLSRLTTTEQNALVSPAGGMMLFNKTSNGFNGFNGTNWRSFALFNTNGTLDVATPLSSTNATTKAYVDSSVGAASLTLTGNVTGSGLLSSPITTTLNMTLNQISAPVANLNLNSHNIINLLDPTTAQHAATKNYVDTRTITLSGAVTGSGALGTTIATTLTNITTSQITNFNSAVTAFRLDQFAIPTSSINLNSQKIINLATPTLTADAATKGYVDTSGTALGAAKYIIQTANALLPNAQILGSLASGLVKNTTTTGVLSIATAGTDYYSPGNPTTILETTLNFFIGNSAGNNSMSGTNNTGLGISVLSLLTTGTSNTALGYHALASVIAGNSNSAFGYLALALNTGSSNSAFGNQALANLSSGTGNCAFGDQVMLGNIIGNYNSGFGLGALLNNIGDNNSAFGASSLAQNQAGAHNSCFGAGSLPFNTTGSYNSALGELSGSAAINTNNSVFLGYNAGPSVDNLTNTVAIGYNSAVGASNCMVLGGTGTNQLSVGIGLTPHCQLQLPTIHANRKIVLYETANNDHQVYGFGTASGTFRFQIDINTSNYIFNVGVSSSASNELARLTGAGNLLIGQTAADAKLVANGGIRNVVGEDSCIRVVSGSNAAKIELAYTAASVVNSLWELRSQSDGVFSIYSRTSPTAATGAKLQIDTASTTYIVRQSYAFYYGTASANTVVATAGTFTKLTWPTSITTSLNCYTYSTSKLSYNPNISGSLSFAQKAFFSLSGTTNAPSSNGEITTFAIYKNGSLVSTIRTTLQSTNAGGVIFSVNSVALGAIVTMTAADFLEIYVTHSVSGRTITITDFNFIISST